MNIISNVKQGGNELPFETSEQQAVRLAPLRKEIAKSYEIVMEICRQANAPEAVRNLIDSLIRLSNGELHFKAYDADVAKAFFENEPMREALKKKVQRWRKKLEEWQTQSGITLVQFDSGGQTYERGADGKPKPKNFPCEYCIVVLDLASKVLAENMPIENAVRKILGELPQLPTHINEKRKRKMTTERASKSSLSFMRRALEIAKEEGYLTEVVEELSESVLDLLTEYKEAGRTDSSYFDGQVKTNDTTINTLYSFSSSSFYNDDKDNEDISSEDINQPTFSTAQELSMMQRAINVTQLGFRVFPVHSVDNGVCSCDYGDKCGTKGKHPRIVDFQSSATSDNSKIKEWWRKWRNANIGIATGNVGNQNLVVLDVDPRHNGLESLQELEDEFGKLPETLTAITGSDGRHFIFCAPSGVNVKNLQNGSALGNGLDVRGDGGFIVAAGSMHVSGNRYEWIDESVSIAEIPAWMIDTLTLKTENPESEPIGKNVALDETKNFARFSNFNGSTAVRVVEGERNDFLFSKAIGLFHNGYEKSNVEWRVGKWNNDACSPPVSNFELAKLIDSAEKTSQREI